jgi:hypothetical protein
MALERGEGGGGGGRRERQTDTGRCEGETGAHVCQEGSLRCEMVACDRAGVPKGEREVEWRMLCPRPRRGLNGGGIVCLRLGGGRCSGGGGGGRPFVVLAFFGTGKRLGTGKLYVVFVV